MRFLSILSIAFMCACTTSTAGDIKDSSSVNTSQKVLVELFTSQGCSSCPSADKLVSNLAQTDTNLIVLSFHVDYWDRLGWKDVFSNRDYTLRQQQYAQALHAESVYTPQAVVQGQFEMVGSNRTGIVNALNKARENSDDRKLIAMATTSRQNINVSYEVGQSSGKQQIMAALVQTHASTAIARGENSGVQLTGYNVVRNFVAAPMTNKGGNLSLILPDDLTKDNASVVVFVQDISSKKVEAVAQIKI